tara:strand:+ start:539 stop:1051 length:513 start_codon:yes stop_codon:yes gene_type:complete
MKTRILLISLVLLSTLAHLADAKNRPIALPLDGKDLKGKKVRLADLKGNVVVISFWATWCAPCKKELKFLNELLKTKSKNGFRVIAISIDGPESAADIRTVTKRYRLSMPVIHDKEGAIIAVWNSKATVPFSIFIDRRGRIADKHVGFSKGYQKELEKRIDELLTEVDEK